MTTNEFYKDKATSTTELRNDEEGVPPTDGHTLIRHGRASNTSFYHLGIAGNFYEVVHPRCERRSRRTKKRL